MTRFVAALLIARGPAVIAAVDPGTPGCEGLGDVQPSARLLRAFAEGRKQRAADEALMRELGEAMAPVPGGITDAGMRARDIHQQQGGDE